MSSKNVRHNFIYLVILYLLLFIPKQVAKIFSDSFNLTKSEDKINLDRSILRVKHVNVFTEDIIIFIIYWWIAILTKHRKFLLNFTPRRRVLIKIFIINKRKTQQISMSWQLIQLCLQCIIHLLLHLF